MVSFIENQLTGYYFEVFTTSLLLQVEEFVSEIDHIASQFLGCEAESAEVSIHHHSVGHLINFNVGLNVVSVVHSVPNSGIPAEFEFKLLGKDNPVG